MMKIHQTFEFRHFVIKILISYMHLTVCLIKEMHSNICRNFDERIKKKNVSLHILHCDVNYVICAKYVQINDTCVQFYVFFPLDIYFW